MGSWERGADRAATDQAAGRRLSVPEAAEVLGISEDAVRSRIKRGTLETAHEGSRVFVVLGATDRPTAQAQPTDRPSERDELVDEMRERMRWPHLGEYGPPVEWERNPPEGAGGQLPALLLGIRRWRVQEDDVACGIGRSRGAECRCHRARR